MNTITRILLVALFGLLLFPRVASGQKEIFIKRIEFKLDVLSDIEYENEYFMTLKLSKGATYVFKIKNHVENYAGEAVLELLDADQLIMTNLVGDKYFEGFAFQCQKTGFYDVLIKFRDNRLGNSIIDIMMKM